MDRSQQRSLDQQCPRPVHTGFALPPPPRTATTASTTSPSRHDQSKDGQGVTTTQSCDTRGHAWEGQRPSASREEVDPPSYEETRAAEPNNSRFGRWRTWVEKRGLERRQLREELNRSGQLEKSSWDLPASPSLAGPSRSHEPEAAIERQCATSVGLEEADIIARTRDALMENRLSTSQYSISNPDYLVADPASWASSTTREPRSRASSTASATRGGRAGSARTRMTKNIIIEQLGSRFERGLPEKPLCGMMLPTQAASPTSLPEEDRFLLVGTAEGLYFVDLDSTNSSSALFRNSMIHLDHLASPQLTGDSSIRTRSLWSGLGVYHLECYVEPAKPRSEGAQGLLVMLVDEGTTSGLELRMWSLAAIINLVKWRTYNESSKPLDLSMKPAQSPSTRSRNASLNGLRKSILNPPSPKGKQLYPGSASPASVHPNSTSHTGASRHKEDLSPADDREAIPREWYNSSTKLPLPKPHPPVLFFNISRMPSRHAFEGILPNGSKGFEDDSDDEDLTNDQLRKRAKAREEEGKLFLVVATKGVVFIFESSLEQRRSWRLTRELTAPATPRFTQLIRSPQTSQSPHIDASTRPPRPAKSSASSTSIHQETSSYPSDLCLLLGMSHRVVVIRLTDYSVTEVVTEHANATIPLSRSRTKSVSNSIRSTSSSRGAPKHLHRPIASLNFNLKDNPIVKRVQQVLDNRPSGIPAGFTGQENITLGRRLNENGSSMEDLGRSSSIASASRHEEPKWIASDEMVLQLGRGKRNLVRFELLTQGHETQLLAMPLAQDCHNEARVEDLSNSALCLVPIHTFTWPSDLKIRQVTHTLTSTPPATRGRQETDIKQSHLVLVAFTSTGLSVQEGYIAHETILNPSPGSSPAFTPTQTSSVTDLSELSLNDPEDQDLSASATLDFATDSGHLCGSLPVSAERSGHTQSSTYFYTRSHGDYLIKRIMVHAP